MLAIFDELTLLSLPAVLFPGGERHLRIFEQGDLQRVRECSENNQALGVSWMLRGREAEGSADPAAIGTLARISDFYSCSDGVLGIRIEGEQRFRALQTRQYPDGLIRASVEIWPTEIIQPVPAEYGLLVTILERLVEQFVPPWRDAGRDHYDDAVWVSYRLAELLPLDEAERQILLETETAPERLDEMLAWLPRFQRD